jgi:hypothetical protein
MRWVSLEGDGDISSSVIPTLTHLCSSLLMWPPISTQGIADRRDDSLTNLDQFRTGRHTFIGLDQQRFDQGDELFGRYVSSSSTRCP